MPLPPPRAQRWSVVGAIVLPLLAMTIYLLWLWPRPSGTSFLAQTGPYLLSLATGLPFVFRLARGRPRAILVLVYLPLGFVILWVYAVAVLCGARGVCL